MRFMFNVQFELQVMKNIHIGLFQFFFRVSKIYLKAFYYKEYVSYMH